MHLDCRAQTSRAVALVALVLSLACSAIGRAAAPSPEWAALQHFDTKVLQTWSRAAAPDAQGAVSVNKNGGYINVGFQRESVDQVPYGILTHNAAAIDSALTIQEYAFNHQRRDGGFQYAERNAKISSGATPSPLAEASAAAFFLYDAGHTLLLLRESPWFQSDPSLAGLRRRSAQLEQHVGLALSWLVPRAQLLDADRGALNRRFVYAAAYMLPGVLLQRDDAENVGERFLRDGLAQQAADGTFPESGGFDSSYQAVSLYLLEVLYLQLPQSGDLHSQLQTAIARGLKREAAAVLSSGEVSTKGNTRVGGRESYFGHVKRVDTRMVILAFEYGAQVTGDASLQRLAERVHARYH